MAWANLAQFNTHTFSLVKCIILHSENSSIFLYWIVNIVIVLACSIRKVKFMASIYQAIKQCQMQWKCYQQYLIMPSTSMKLNVRYTGFTLSICLSVHPARHLFIWGWNLICSVSSRILVESITYIYIWSSNFRRCFTCYFFFNL